MEVITTDEYNGWYADLTEADFRAVNRVVDLLEAKGVTLRFPYSSQIKGSDHAMRELRVQSGGRPIRIFYIFDETRDAVLLIGGDKTGQDDFYEKMIPVADAIAKQYLAEQKEEATKEKK